MFMTPTCPLPSLPPPAPSDLVHRQLTRVSTLHRLFRPSMTRGLSRQDAEAPLQPPARRSFKERVRDGGGRVGGWVGSNVQCCLVSGPRAAACCLLDFSPMPHGCPHQLRQCITRAPCHAQVMFWRRSKDDLQPIDEAEEKEGGEALEMGTLGSDSTMAGLPSGAVVVDVEGGGAPSRVPSIAADIPLLEHSPPSIAIKPPPHKRTPTSSPSPAATPVARGATLASQPSLPSGRPPLPAPSPRQPSKLERLRSQALEAARDEVLGKPGQGFGGTRGSAGSEAPSLARRFSGESERGAAMRRPSLPRDGRMFEGTVHGPGSTVHGGAGGTVHGGTGGTVHGAPSVGGTVHAGVVVGLASREASTAAGATARFAFARTVPIKRSTSLQSHKSLAAGIKAPAAAAVVDSVDPVAKKVRGLACTAPYWWLGAAGRCRDQVQRFPWPGCFQHACAVQHCPCIAHSLSWPPCPLPPTRPPQPVLQHANSMTSSQPSKQLQMALKMSKMEKYIRKHALEVGVGRTGRTVHGASDQQPQIAALTSPCPCQSTSHPPICSHSPAQVTFKDALNRVERNEKVTTGTHRPCSGQWALACL